MRKLVLMAVAVVAVSFASCGNKSADAAAKAQQDSIFVADSIAAVENAEKEAVAATATNDSLSTDSTKTTEAAAK